ncbi:AAA family ATPase [Staphylospora marina]|uniref:AAA family ATPase n=1 Tax=Staphylospora marina TaxID=2490858 RepID=UPI001F14EE2F
MKTQLALIIALSIRPRLLILDEPTGGLDPLAKSRMFSLILEEVAENGTAVLVSSHQLGDLERIIDHVGLLVNGKGARTWSLDDLKAGARKIQAVFPDGLPEELLRMPEILHVEKQGSVYILTTGGGFEKVMARIREHRPVHVETLGLGLEEWLIRQVTKEEWTRAAASSE